MVPRPFQSWRTTAAIWAYDDRMILRSILSGAAPVLALACVLTACAAPPSGSVSKSRPARPNVILIVTDDQGYGDVGRHGNTMIRTPHLDQLHDESVRLTDFHVDPTCSPTRSALMTGRYSSRTGVWHTIMGRSLMDGAEVTVAEVLGGAGYRTGMFGKWHLGDNAPLRPQDQGFEHVVWHHGGGVGQGPDYWGNDYTGDTYEVNGEWQAFDGYCTDVWFEEARAFIESGGDEPFFAYIATNAPHWPYLVDAAYSGPYEAMGVAPTMAKFYGMVENIDENVGRLRAQLERLGIADDTLIVFMTDNGTAAGHSASKAEAGGEAVTWPGFNAAMRGNKGSEYDGGHRVPCFVHWPNGGVTGGRDVPSLAAHIDLLPTLAELCRAPLEGTLALDGVSLAKPLRAERGDVLDRTLFVHSQRIDRPEKWRKTAVMTKRWRLVNGAELYDMRSDPGQAVDLSQSSPEVVAQLSAAYDGWWASLGGAHERTVSIDVGGAETATALMAHDWHTTSGGTPWDQTHVRRGTIGNGFWALNVARAGRYEVELSRWPKHLERAGEIDRATLVWTPAAGEELRLEQGVEPSTSTARFELRAEEGIARLQTTLRRTDGQEHGAYFAELRWVGP